jgi:hypothetical protein
MEAVARLGKSVSSTNMAAANSAVVGRLVLNVAGKRKL